MAWPELILHILILSTPPVTIKSSVGCQAILNILPRKKYNVPIITYTYVNFKFVLKKDLY